MAQIMIRFALLKKQKKTSKTEKNSGDNIGDDTIEPRRVTIIPLILPA